MKDNPSTKSGEYTKILLGQRASWKRWLDVQAPYRRHIRSLKLGRVLEIGCGIGRNLVNLGDAEQHCGIDHNEESVCAAKAIGLNALTVDDFLKSNWAQQRGYDTLLLSHLLEHLTEDEARRLIEKYLIYLKHQGRILIITPQEAGYASDATHVTYFDHTKTRSLLSSVGLSVQHQYSFPFPAWAGKIFKYNEFVCIASLNDEHASP
jgi:2-polyprenyl-3-methyl-5-hydroxy-6-metoxy-1,4-benzoquinol methylase